MKKGYTAMLLAGLLLLLLGSFLEVPTLGNQKNPAYNEVTHHYLDNVVEETGAMNVVSGIITDYRAFDTLGEATVLFTGITAVLTVIKINRPEDEEEKVRING